MPAYNSEKYIAIAIDSLLKQTFTDFELLVINDASKDATADIVKVIAQKDPRVKLLDNEFEKGIAGGFNTGMKHSQGELIARADSDDIYKPDRLQLQVDYLDQHPQISIVGGGFAPFTEAHGHRADYFQPENCVQIAWESIFGLRFANPTLMLRREVFEAIPGGPNVPAEDYAYSRRVITKFRGANVQKILVDYRETEQGWYLSNTERIALSVEEEGRGLLTHYVGNSKGYNLLKKYYAHEQLSVWELVRLMILNTRIMFRICSQYQMSIFDKEAKFMWKRFTKSYWKLLIHKPW